MDGGSTLGHAELGTLAIGLYNFDGVRDDNLPFRKGEVITIIEMNETGWWKGVNSGGKVGIFPYNYVQPRKAEEQGTDFRVVQAVVGYEAEEEDELTFEAGDKITVLKPVDEEWSLGRLFATSDHPNERIAERVVGKFLLNYVENTGEVDSQVGAEEADFADQEHDKKLRYSRAVQIERKQIEEETSKLLEEERQKLEAEEKLQAERAAKSQETANRRQMEEEIARMKEEMERINQAAEEARKRAEKAEEDLIAARAEKERLRIAADKKESVNDANRKEYLKQREDIVSQKITTTVKHNTTEDGFSAPAPMPARVEKKFKVPSKFAKLGKSGEKCKKCEKSVTFGPTGMKAINASWHKECFQCSTCSKVLRSGWAQHGGWPYCQKCHSAGFGIKGFGFGGAVAGAYRAKP